MAFGLVTVTLQEIIDKDFEKESQFYDYLVAKMIDEKKIDVELYSIKINEISRHLFIPKTKTARFLIKYDLKYKYNLFKRILLKINKVKTSKKQIKVDTAKRFSKWASSYDDSILQCIIFQDSHREILKELKPSKKSELRLLDIACGTGKFAIKFAKFSENIKVDGVDISQNMIKTANKKLKKKNIKNIRFQVGDSEKLPYDDNTFDVAICTHAFHHFPNKRKALAEMYRVLKPEGKLLIIDGSRDIILGQFIFGLIIKLYEKTIYHTLKHELQHELKLKGFKEIKQKIFFNLFVPLLFTSAIK